MWLALTIRIITKLATSRGFKIFVCVHFLFWTLVTPWEKAESSLLGKKRPGGRSFVIPVEDLLEELISVQLKQTYKQTQLRSAMPGSDGQNHSAESQSYRNKGNLEGHLVWALFILQLMNLKPKILKIRDVYSIILLVHSFL